MYLKSKSLVSESVTRSPNELFWTANKKGINQFQKYFDCSEICLTKARYEEKTKCLIFFGWKEEEGVNEALGANVMFTTDVGLPQAQVCYICQIYGRRKNHKTKINSVLKISYFVREFHFIPSPYSNCFIVVQHKLNSEVSE